MTIKEAIFKTLSDLGGINTHNEIYDHIIKKGYYSFGTAKTPKATISSELGNFIRNGDTRVKRVKQKNGKYAYYLRKNEEDIDISILTGIDNEYIDKEINKPYKERDLHILLSSYLKNTDTYSKTIFHEHSKNSNDSNQTWTHPDIVGVQFLKLQSKSSQNLLKSINKLDTFNISSYELKREINSDSDLKKAYFQAVSNSSWANFGYLVAFEFSDSLINEMERLNQSFGIGIIELNSNPYKSKILFQANYKELDFKTIDKLCIINKDFNKFIEQI